MNFQSEFKALLNPLATGGAWANVAPDSPVRPYITYFRVTATEQNSLNANGGLGNLINTRMQIDAWASTYSEADSIARAVKAALKGWGAQNTIELEQDFYEPDTNLHRVLLDVSIWHT